MRKMKKSLRKMHQMREQERRPPTPLVAEGTREKQGMSAGLTNQLHQTAESVMKWKMQLESEIKQRDSKISEYQETIKSMKSSLLGQQQQSETLSHKLQIEMLKRGDVTTRIDTTRNICASLQQHCNYLADVMKKCYDEKDLIKAAQIEYVSELEKLIEKTENCSEVVKSLTKQRDELMEIYLEEKAEREKITEDANTLKSLIGEKMENAKAAVAKEAEKAGRMEASLALNEEKCQTLTSLNEHLQQQITLNEQMHTEKERALEAELVNLKSLFEDNKLALVDEQAKLVDFENKAAALQAEISKLEEEKTAATEKDQLSVVKISELSLKLDEISQDLTKKTDELEKLRAEKEFLEEKLLVIAELEAELAKEKLEKASFSEENMKLTQALSGVEEDLKCSKSAFDLSQKELEALNVRLGKALEEMQTLQNSNQELDKNLQESDLKLKAEIDASQQLKQLLEQKKKEAEDLKQTLENVSSSSASETGQLSIKLSNLSRSLADAKTQLQQKIEIISNLSSENIFMKESMIDLGAALKNEQECSARKITVLEGKLSDKVEELKIFNSGHSTMQESLQSLQEELEGLHTQLNESNEERKTLVAEKKELEKTLKSAKSEKNSAEGKLKRMETKVANLEKEKKEMKEKMAKARSDSLQSGEQKDQAISDFEEKIKEKEEQIAELEQSLNEAKAANEDELKGKESKLSEMQSEKNKLDDKLDAVAKEKLDLEGKLSKLSAQLTDTIKNLNEMSTKYEAERQKLKDKIKSSQDQLSAKHDEVSKLQVRLSSQTSALSTTDIKLGAPASPSISASPLRNSAPKSAVSQKGMEEMKRSIMKGDNVRMKMNKSKIMFSDIINYISLEDDETSSISSSRVPTTPTKAKTQNTVPTTPRKSFAPVKLSTPQKALKVIDADDGSDVSSDLNVAHMNEEVKNFKHVRSPARAFAKNESLATPTKRMSTPVADAPQKNKKGRLSGSSRLSSKYKQLEIN